MTQAKPAANAAVPAHYQGVWQRELLETASSKDVDSLVFWVQAQHHHIDLRIPASRANLRQVQSLQEYSEEELLLLAAQQGFAGITQVTPASAQSSEVCQWLREIDFQPTLEARDIGKMVFTEANTVIETGLDEAYLEVWRRLEHSQTPCTFQSTIGANRHNHKVPAYVIRAGNYVAYARSRSVALPKVSSLNHAIRAYKPAREQLLDWLDMEISFGEMVDDEHWKILHSSLAFKENLITPLIG